MTRLLNKLKTSEFYTFVIAFVAFAFQILSVKIVEFLKYDIYLFDKFVAPLYGMAFGAYLYKVYHWPRFFLLRCLSQLFLIFVLNILFGWRFLFVPLLLLIFILLGAALLEALSQLTIRRALVVDTAGGICGLVFTYYSIKLINIEIQLMAIATMFSIIVFWSRRKMLDFLFLLIGCLFIYTHLSYDTFNFIRSRTAIPSRYAWFQNTARNGQYVVRQQPETYLLGKWTEFDRVDLFVDRNSKFRAYLNNELYMGFDKEKPPQIPVIGQNVHIVGFGLGEEVNSLAKTNYKNIVASETNSYLFELGKNNLKHFLGPRIQLENVDGFLLSEDYKDYFDLVWALFPSAVANYSSLTNTSSSNLTVEAFEQIYYSIRNGGFLVTAIHAYRNRSIDWSGASTVYKFMAANGIDANKQFATLYSLDPERVRIYYIIKKGNISEDDLKKFYDWNSSLCTIATCGKHPLIEAYQAEIADKDQLIVKFPPPTRDKFIFSAQKDLISPVMWSLLITLSFLGLIVGYHKRILFSKGTVGLFPFFSGALAAMFQLYLNSVYVFLLKIPALSYVVVSTMFLVGGMVGYLVSLGTKVHKVLVIGTGCYLSCMCIMVLEIINPHTLTNIQLLLVTMCLSLPFIVLNSSLYATYLERNNFLVCYTVNIFGYMTGLISALICARYVGVHQLLGFVFILWLGVITCVYRKM